MSDPVNHPTHYSAAATGLPCEVIEITEQFGFVIGNALKYILRHEHKGQPIQDLEKAVWYLQREIETRKGRLE